MLKFSVCGFAVMTVALFGGAVPSKEQPTPIPAPPDCGKSRRMVHLDFRHREGRGIGYHSGYTTAELFMVPYHPGKQWTPLIDVRGHYFNNDRWALNAGLGFRYLPKRWCSVWGGNVYYDWRTTHRKGFQRIGVGMEYLAPKWEARLNGYLPLTSTGPSFDRHFFRFRGTQALLKEKQNVALYGGNAEVGGLYTYGDLRVFGGGGPYAYTHEHVRTAVGMKARVSALYLDLMHLEMAGSWDTLFHGRIQGEVALVIPLGRRHKVEMRPCSADCREARMLDDRLFDRIEREEIIALKERTRVKVAIDPDTDRPYTFIFVNNLSGSDGTFGDPFSNLADAQSVALPGDIFYVFPGSNAPYTDPVTLQNRQKLWGSSNSHTLATQWGPITINPFTRAIPTIAPNAIVITLGGNNTEVSGFLLRGSGTNDVISAVGVQNFTLEQSALISIFGNGLTLQDTTGSVSVQNCFISRQGPTAGFGILLQNSMSTGTAEDIPTGFAGNWFLCSRAS